MFYVLQLIRLDFFYVGLLPVYFSKCGMTVSLISFSLKLDPIALIVVTTSKGEEPISLAICKRQWAWSSERV